jgi:hypothetical protein
MKYRTFIPVLLVVASLLILFSVPVHQKQQLEGNPEALQFVGKVLPNGDVGVLYYSGPTGTTIIHSGTTVPVNQVCLEIYSPHAGNLSIQGKQFSKYIQENQTITVGKNQTYTSKIVVPYNPQKFNSSMQVQTRSFQETLISIPSSSQQEYVTLTIDNTTFSFYHKTSPDLIPVIFSSLGNLGIALGYTLMGVVVFFLGSITASLLLRRMKYWPEFGKLGWFLILTFLLIAMAVLIFSAYYQLAYLAWYDWLIPFYIFATLAMLELWPQTWSKLFLVILGSSEEEGEQDWDVTFPRVAKNNFDGTWEYLRPGRTEAIKRIFRHIPISFNGSLTKPEGIPLKPNEENLTTLFFLKNFPELKRLPPIERKHLRRRSGKITEYSIPLSAHAQKEVGEFVSELRAVAEFADENESLRKENRNFRIRLENGKVRYNNEEINEISRKIFGATMEYHKGKPEAKKEEKQKEETDDKKEK